MDGFVILLIVVAVIVGGVLFYWLVGRAQGALEDTLESGVERFRGKRLAERSRSEIVFALNTKADIKNLLTSRFQNKFARVFMTNDGGQEGWNYYVIERGDTVYIGAGPVDGSPYLGFVYGVRVQRDGLRVTGVAVLGSLDPSLAVPNRELLPIFKERFKDTLVALDTGIEYSETDVDPGTGYRPVAQEIIDGTPGIANFGEIRAGFAKH